MADNALAVQITADIAQFVTALNQATARIEDASKAMVGSNDRVRASSEGATQAQIGLSQSVQNSIREYAAGAAAGLTIANAIEKVGEFAKEATKWIYDSAEAVNDLSEKFKELRVTTGESLDSLNELYGAAQMSGQGVELVESLMAGWTKGIKSNSDVLIANGVAANKAALDGMSFKEYLLKVYEISQEMKTPAEANVFLTEALGRSGAQAAPKLKELAENLETGTEALKTGNIVTLERLEMQEREEKATGALGLAYQKLYASIGDGVNKALVPVKEWVGWGMKTKVAQDDVQKALEAGIITTEHWYDSLGKLAGKLAETLDRFKQVAAEATKVAQNSMDVGAGDGARRARSLVEAPKEDKPKKAGGSKSTYVDTEALSQIEMIEWVERYRKQKAEEREREEKRQASERDRLLEQEKAAQRKAADEEERLAKEVQAAWERNTVQGGIFAYLREAREAMRQWGSFTKAIMQGVEQSFAAGIRGILSGTMSLSKGLKTIWKGIADTVIGALAQMAAKWLVAAIASKVFAKASAQGAQEEAVGKQMAAAAGIFNAHAYIPFVGPAIAAGLIAMMNATLVGNMASAKGMIVANAKGSLVTSPTLALIGEAGENEVVAPETAFQDWAGNLTSNIIANQQRVQAYQMGGASLAQQARESAGGGRGYVDLRGAIIAGESAESSRIIGNLIRKHRMDDDRRNG